jgi:tetratricopeptide (TPR) repeat protein
LVERASLGSAIDRTPSRRTGALVFAAAAVCFLGALRGGFVWDDWALIDRTLGIRGLDARHLYWMLTTTQMANNTPLAWLSYALDYAVWGLNPVGYHLTNILLHALNAVLLYRLAALLLRRVFPGETPDAIELGAAVAALAFAAHPLRAESVAWASERRDVLAGAFYLSALLFYAKSALGRDKREKIRCYAASLVFYAGAALCKATVAPLPLALLALDYYPLRRLGAGEPPRETRARLVEKLPYLALAAASAAMAVRAQVLSRNLIAVSDHDWTSRLAQAAYGMGFYVRKTLLPTGLHALYPLERMSLLSVPTLVSAATIAAVAGACAAAGVARRAQAALWGYYLILLLPVSGLLQNGRQLVALRYSYLSCLGWAVLAGAAAVSAVRSRKKRPARSAAIFAALALWLGSNAWAVQRQVALWHDDRALWEDVLRRYPLSPDANANIADALLHDKDLRGAESYARLALRLDPANASANFTLAKTLWADRRPAETRDALERGLTLIDRWGDGDALLGVLLNGEGRTDEAVVHLRRAAALLPGSAETQSNAGSILALHGRYAEALPYFERAARLDPGYAVQLERVRRDLARSPPR